MSTAQVAGSGEAKHEIGQTTNRPTEKVYHSTQVAGKIFFFFLRLICVFLCPHDVDGVQTVHDLFIIV